MYTNIIAGGTQESRGEYIQSVLTPRAELIHVFAEKSSIPIKQIHTLLTSLATAPRLPRLIWIEEAQLATTPAQNALLKLLEEPPLNTTIYLTTQSQSSLLPTIRSRCAHQALKRLRNVSRNEVVWETQLPLLKTIMGLSPGDRLMSIEKRDRAETILWITQLETALRVKLATPNLTMANYQTLAIIANLTQNAHKELLSNCSISLVIQNFYLLLPHVLQ